jgi:hypothetical protein
MQSIGHPYKISELTNFRTGGSELSNYRQAALAALPRLGVRRVARRSSQAAWLKTKPERAQTCRASKVVKASNANLFIAALRWLG